MKYCVSLYEKDTYIQYSVEEDQDVEPQIFYNIAKKEFASLGDITKIIYNIGKHAYFLNYNKAVLKLIKFNIGWIRSGIISEIRNLLANVNDLNIRNELKPAHYSIVKKIINARIKGNDIKIDDPNLQVPIYALRKSARIQKLADVLGKNSKNEVTEHMKQFNTILLDMEKNFNENQSAKEEIMTKLELKYSDIDELRDQVSLLEFDNPLLGIMGWQNHDKFNEMYKKLIDVDMFDKDNRELKIEEFRQKGEVEQISFQDYEHIKDYLNLRGIPYNKNEFPNLKQTGGIFGMIPLYNNNKITEPRDLRPINNMLRRIAIDQWEAIRPISYSSIKALIIKNAEDKIWKETVLKEILSPLYHQGKDNYRDEGIQYSISEKHFAQGKLLKKIAKEQIESSEYNAKIIHNIGRHAYFLNHNKAVLELIKFNIDSIAHNINDEVKKLMDTVDENFLKNNNIEFDSLIMLRGQIETFIRSKGIEINLNTRAAIYHLRRLARIQKLKEVLNKDSGNAVIEFMKQFNPILSDI